MGTYQTADYLFGSGLTLCLSQAHKNDKEQIKKCYYRSFPEAKVLCPSQLDGMIDMCGWDDRVHPECNRYWAVVQRCVKSHGLWTEMNRFPTNAQK